MIKYSLVGYDSSDSSRRAFRFTVELARATGGRVRAMYVIPLARSACMSSRWREAVVM